MATTEPLQIHLLVRVGDSEVLNEIATIEQVLEAEAITDENRRQTDSPAATARIQIDMAAALRACADEIDIMQGVERKPSEGRADLIERMRVAYTDAWEDEDARQAQARRDGTWAATSVPHARSRAGIVAALGVLESVEQKIEAGIAAAIASLRDRAYGAGSDLDDDIYVDDDVTPVYIGVRGHVDIRQLVREILEATR